MPGSRNKWSGQSRVLLPMRSPHTPTHRASQDGSHPGGRVQQQARHVSAAVGGGQGQQVGGVDACIGCVCVRMGRAFWWDAHGVHGIERHLLYSSPSSLRLLILRQRSIQHAPCLR